MAAEVSQALCWLWSQFLWLNFAVVNGLPVVEKAEEAG